MLIQTSEVVKTYINYYTTRVHTASHSHQLFTMHSIPDSKKAFTNLFHSKVLATLE